MADAEPAALARTLAAATEKARGRRGDPEAEARLEVLASLWSQVGTAAAADMLGELVLDPNVDVRQAAGEGLAELAEADFELFARTLRRTLGSDSGYGPEVEQLAFLLSGLDDPRVTELLVAMLDHADEQVVVAALEVAGEWAWDDRVVEVLSRLTLDARCVTFDDEEEGRVTVEISELASQVVETVRSFGGRR